MTDISNIKIDCEFVKKNLIAIKKKDNPLKKYVIEEIK